MVKKVLPEQSAEPSDELDELRLENNFLKKIIAQLPIHIYWKSKDGHYLGCNELQAKSLGLSSPEDIIGRTSYELGYGDMAEQIIENDTKVMAGNKTLIAEEVVPERDAGNQTYISRKIPLLGSNGETLGLLGASVNISKQKELEVELREANQKLEASKQKSYEHVAKLHRLVTGQDGPEGASIALLIDSVSDFLENIIAKVPGHIYWYDKNNVYLGCNDEQAVSAGLKSRKDIAGKTNFDMPWHAQAKAHEEYNNKVMESGKAHIEEELAGTPDNPKVYLSKKVPLKNNRGEVIGVLGSSIDITRQKELENKLQAAKEEAEAANKAKTMFIEDASHNARTPLASIYGAKELFKVQRDNFNAEQQEWIDILDESVNRFQDMIERILDFSRIEGGHFKIKHAPIDFYVYVHHMADTLQGQANEKGLKLTVDYAADMPHRIVSDEYCINSILLNLLSNALKFTEKGVISINVSREKDRLLLVVSDTGCGIRKEDLEQIFERFNKVVPSSRLDNQGYGLGLSTVRYMAAFLEGDVSLKSEPGKGSTFTLNIPLEVPESE